MELGSCSGFRCFPGRSVNPSVPVAVLDSARALPATRSGAVIKANNAPSKSPRPWRAAAADNIDVRDHRLCAGHDRQRSGRHGLEGARRQEDRAGERQRRHPEPRPFAFRACLAHHSGGRYRDGRNGRPAEIPRSRAGAVQQIPGRNGENAAPIARDRRCRCQGQLDLFVVSGNTAPQHLGPQLLSLPSRYAGQHASDQRAAAVPPRRSILDDRALETDHQARRQLRRGRRRSDRQGLLQRLLPDIPARPRRRHQPDTE